jgi:hypothetical protein
VHHGDISSNQGDVVGLPFSRLARKVGRGC